MNRCSENCARAVGVGLTTTALLACTNKSEGLPAIGAGLVAGFATSLYLHKFGFTLFGNPHPISSVNYQDHTLKPHQLTRPPNRRLVKKL